MLGLGAIAGGGIMGSGAFTSVSAKRSISIETTADYSALLQIEPIEDSGIDGEDTGRSFLNGQTIQFEIPGDEDGENQNAEGIGKDSIYDFPDLFKITNQGAQPVILYSQYTGNNFSDIALVGENGILKRDPPTLSVGESISVGLHINTHNSEIGEFEETLTLIAKSPGE